MQAHQIKYRTVVVPGQRHFDCCTLRAMLSTIACAKRWNAARSTHDERRDMLVSCKRCPVGSAHFKQHRQEFVAGQERPDPGAPRAALCLRCGRPATRMIGGELCPSCHNRYREWARGRNARGTPPTGYVAPRRWRVGILEPDGRPGWRMLEGQHFAEAQARAVRSGFKLHCEHPGVIYRDADTGRFEYRDQAGRILLEFEDDGQIQFVGVERLHEGEEPALVHKPAFMATVEEAAEMLITGDGLCGDWHQTDLACRRCRAGVLHARRYRGATECRCSASCS